MHEMFSRLYIACGTKSDIFFFIIHVIMQQNICENDAMPCMYVGSVPNKQWTGSSLPFHPF